MVARERHGVEEEGGVRRRNAGYAEVGPAPRRREQERAHGSFPTEILLGSVLHLSFLLSLFFVFQLEAGGQGRDPKSG